MFLPGYFAPRYFAPHYFPSTTTAHPPSGKTGGRGRPRGRATRR